MNSVEEAIRTALRVKPNSIQPYVGRVSRAALGPLFNLFGYKSGAEIGVWQGEYSEWLCRSNPDMKLFCIDPWLAYPDMPDQKLVEGYYQEAKQRLSPFNAEIMRMSSLEAVKKIPDGSLDFVYIDAAHEFDPCMLDIIYWSPKVKSGGIVAGHDFVFIEQVGVIYAVEAYIRGHNIPSWYITSAKRGENPTWLWVKP